MKKWFAFMKEGRDVKSVPFTNMSDRDLEDFGSDALFALAHITDNGERIYSIMIRAKTEEEALAVAIDKFETLDLPK